MAEAIKKDLVRNLASSVFRYRNKAKDTVDDNGTVTYTTNDFVFIGKKNNVGKVAFSHIELYIFGDLYIIYPDGRICIFDTNSVNLADEEFDEVNDDEISPLVNVSDDERTVYVVNSYINWRMEIFEKMQA